MSGKIRRLKSLLVLAASMLVIGPLPCARATELVERVQFSLDVMTQWLGESSKAVGWQRYLRTEELLHQLEKGDNADPNQVASILERYSQDVPGLNREQFVAVREALKTWQWVLSLPKPEELPSLIRNASEDFVPLEEDRLSQSRQTLATALTRLDRYLSRGIKSKADGWRKYLLWQELNAELDSQETPSQKLLARVQSRYRAHYTGLELPPFAEVRQALGDYGEALSYDSENFQEQFETVLEGLATAIESYTTDPTHKGAMEAAVRLGWLQRSGQVPELVRMVRHHFVQPNLYLDISEDLVRVGFEQEINQTDRIRDFDSGTSISGRSHTIGNITSRLVPNAEQAEVEVRLVGTMRSRTRGVNGPATILSSSTTSIDASKRRLATGEGVLSHRAKAQCDTDLNIDDIQGSSAVQSRAWPRARASVPRSEARSSRRAEREISQELDREIGGVVSDINKRYQESYLAPLLRRDEPPAASSVISTAQSIIVRAAQANDFQFAASTVPPQLSGHYDLVTRYHESYINNYVESVYGGTLLTDEQAGELAKQITGGLPEELQPNPDEPWTITLVRRRPITITFADNGYTVTIRGKKFTAGERSIGSMHVSVSYQFQMTSEGVRRVRQGDIQIEPAGFATRRKKILTPEEVAEKAVLKRNFERTFAPVIDPQGLQLLGRWERAGRLASREVISDRGWLALGWQRVEQTQPVANSVSDEPIVNR